MICFFIPPISLARREFREKFIERLISRGGLSREEAAEDFDAGDATWHYDYDDDPDSAADDEMSYWEPE